MLRRSFSTLIQGQRQQPQLQHTLWSCLTMMCDGADDLVHDIRREYGLIPVSDMKHIRKGNWMIFNQFVEKENWDNHTSLVYGAYHERGYDYMFPHPFCNDEIFRVRLYEHGIGERDYFENVPEQYREWLKTFLDETPRQILVCQGHVRLDDVDQKRLRQRCVHVSYAHVCD